MSTSRFTDSLGYVVLLTILIWVVLTWLDEQVFPGRAESRLARLFSLRILVSILGGLLAMLALRHVILRRRAAGDAEAGNGPRAT